MAPSISAVPKNKNYIYFGHRVQLCPYGIIAERYKAKSELSRSSTQRHSSLTQIKYQALLIRPILQNSGFANKKKKKRKKKAAEKRFDAGFFNFFFTLPRVKL